MKRLLTSIAIIAASFGIAGTAHAADEPTDIGCPLGVVPTIGGCETFPDVQPEPSPPECGMGCDGGISTAEFPQLPIGTSEELPPPVVVVVEVPVEGIGAVPPKPEPTPTDPIGVWDHVALAPPW